MSKELGSLIRKLENEYTQGTVTKSKYVTFDMYDDLQKIDAYANSKHTSGDVDALNREKPFFNIVTSAINIWYRATDIDRKNIKIRATKAKHWIASFLANIVLQNWMKKENFGTFLNKWGWTLAKYGSAVLKFVEKEGELHRMVMDWNKLIVDPIDFYNNPVIEVLELTPAQLRKNKAYNQDMVEALIESHAARTTLDGQNKDNRSNYIKIYEIHGELEAEYLNKDGEEKEGQEDMYVQQMHVISFVENKDGEFTDFTLAKGKEERNPYMITHLIEQDGQTLSDGAVKTLFEAQWMVNHTKKSIKDILDMTSLLLMQTSDGNFAGQNALYAMQTGQILIHQPNQPLTAVNNQHDITALQNFGNEWEMIGSKQVGISEAMQGATPKSGTAWRQTEAVLQESHSLFELMTENKGLAIEDMLRTYIIPFLKKQLDNSKEISAILEAHDIEKIDKLYVKSEAMKAVKNEIKQSLLKGEIPVAIDPQAMVANAEQDVQKQVAEMGNQRFFKPSEISDKTWAEIFKDFEWEVEVDVTGEASDAQQHLTTLVTLYQNLITTGNAEAAQKVMSKILEITGAFSPIEMVEMPKPQAVPQVAQASQSVEAPALQAMSTPKP